MRISVSVFFVEMQNHNERTTVLPVEEVQRF